ncbi:MAG TPA: hypothetical protein PK176_09450 [Acidobacteriota bacterium]|nr:hypothetical protein [Acidobacteriota bacterium]HQM63524.1 hypothetical protein [Acidobacteriota bacterium]
MFRILNAAGSPRHGKVRGKVWLVFVLLGSALLAGPVPADSSSAAAPAVVRFEGNWSASGTRQTLAMGPERTASILRLSGALVLDLHEGMSRGFRCETVSFFDGREQALGACVWTDERGDQVFSDFGARSASAGAHVTGSITGGTGRYAGLTGRYEFNWQFMLESPEGQIQGRAVGFKGEARRGAPAPAKQVP